MAIHDLIKTESGWKCKVCDWLWQSKPKTECPGITRYGWNHPDCLKTKIELHKKNLKPKDKTKPDACIYSQKSCCWIWLYDEKNCEVDNPNLPPIYQWDDRRELKTVGELRKINLAPSDDIKADGVAWVWDEDEEWGKWISLYHRDDCQWQPKDNWITKSALKQKYLLSDGWIKKIGEPDRRLENRNWRNAAPIQLYSRQRVEAFLAENATEYAHWLDRREKYLAIFEANRDKIFEKRNLIKQQTADCLRCASGYSTPDGFLCAIYPMGVKYMPCPDWQERSKP
ncbi:hypothetical protein WA1_18815 [Scytonema hofmannii PCC 7110]|uniref:Uncharacterized protein n=1 Tax=Scytonema hofmannii PCC 7110 TaxID=128403 RepID=A0A139XBJ3_9CYAN|nr:hypothetical protein [Scytonema hofmannii]KYC42055.1 hypothetical protein WA1_18815 [Scytonema hofmannii PCC 7110]